MFEGKTIGWAVAGSFCTIPGIYTEIESVLHSGVKIVPIVSGNVASMDTRMGTAGDIIKKLEEVTGNKVIKDINEAEPIGPKKMFDALVILPATGNTIAKLAHGIADTSVLMAAKAHLRNNRPIIIGVSTNDGLSTNARNIGDLLNKKNIYFVPFGQDDYEKKPNSVGYKRGMVAETIERAMRGEQIQPVIS